MFLQVDEALGVFREMVARGCDRNTVTYAALIAACERAGRPQAARELFAEMQREGVKPNVSTYNAVIGACAQSESVMPDNVTQPLHAARCSAVTDIKAWRASPA